MNCGNILREHNTNYRSDIDKAKGNSGDIVKSYVIGQSAAKYLYMYKDKSSTTIHYGVEL